MVNGRKESGCNTGTKNIKWANGAVPQFILPVNPQATATGVPVLLADLHVEL